MYHMSRYGIIVKQVLYCIGCVVHCVLQGTVLCLLCGLYFELHCILYCTVGFLCCILCVVWYSLHCVHCHAFCIAMYVAVCFMCGVACTAQPVVYGLCWTLVCLAWHCSTVHYFVEEYIPSVPYSIAYSWRLARRGGLSPTAGVLGWRARGSIVRIVVRIVLHFCIAVFLLHCRYCILYSDLYFFVWCGIYCIVLHFVMCCISHCILYGMVWYGCLVRIVCVVWFL